MNKYFEEIIKNENLFTELAAKQFSDKENITRDNIKETLQERGAEIRNVIAKTNKIIDEHIAPLLKSPEDMNWEQALELQELAEKLSGYKESVDTGLSYDIRHALTIYAKAQNNDEFFIKNTFYKGLTLFYLEANLFREEMHTCYTDIAAYGDRYEQFDDETRNLIVRAYGNLYISVPDRNIVQTFECYDSTVHFWDTVARKKDPSFPWSAYYNNLYDNLCSTVLSELRRSTRTEPVKKRYIKRFFISAMHLYKQQEQGIKEDSNDYTATEIKALYYLYSAKYYMGLVTAKELIDFLYRVYKQSDNDYTYDDLYKKLHMPALYFYYLSHVSEKDFPTAERDSLVSKMEEDIYSYVMNIPESLSPARVTTLLTNLAVGTHNTLQDFSYLKLLLSLTVFRHAPTYVHSVMVAKIAFAIVEHIAKYHPEKLVGMPDMPTIDDVLESVGEILLFVWFAGLIHDIGKIVYSHMVSFYVRKLNDKEFEMIKQHTSRASSFIKISPNFTQDDMVSDTLKSITNIKFKDNPALFSCFPDIALGHHKSYDGSFGYPRTFDNLASPVKFIIDIITVADSIDAATDSVGRSYAQEKTLEHLKDDLLSQIGDRYSPFVTELVFGDDELYKKIQWLLQKDRYDVYYSCFSTHDFSDTLLPPQTMLY